MNRIARTVFLLAGLGAMVAGCDETPVAPPALLTPPPVPEATSRPTTQQLLNGPRQTLVLGTMPLSVLVPAGWSVKNMEGTGATLLEGPTPAGDAAIQLRDRAVTTPVRLEAINNGAKREMAQSPDSIKMAQLRDIAGAKVMERQRVGRLTNPTLSEPGVKESPPFTWTISVFVPHGENYETYELNFIGLTVDQYEADKALLRGIIDSLAVSGSASGGDATTAPVAPR